MSDQQDWEYNYGLAWCAEMTLAAEVEHLKAALNQCAHALKQCAQELDAQAETVTSLREALHCYGEHSAPCPARYNKEGGNDTGCRCGLAAARSGTYEHS